MKSRSLNFNHFLFAVICLLQSEATSEPTRLSEGLAEKVHAFRARMSQLTQQLTQAEQGFGDQFKSEYLEMLKMVESEASGLKTELEQESPQSAKILDQHVLRPIKRFMTFFSFSESKTCGSHSAPFVTTLAQNEFKAKSTPPGKPSAFSNPPRQVKSVPSCPPGMEQFTGGNRGIKYLQETTRQFEEWELFQKVLHISRLSSAETGLVGSEILRRAHDDRDQSNPMELAAVKLNSGLGTPAPNWRDPKRQMIQDQVQLKGDPGFLDRLGNLKKREIPKLSPAEIGIQVERLQYINHVTKGVEKLSGLLSSSSNNDLLTIKKKVLEAIEAARLLGIVKKGLDPSKGKDQLYHPEFFDQRLYYRIANTKLQSEQIEMAQKFQRQTHQEALKTLRYFAIQHINPPGQPLYWTDLNSNVLLGHIARKVEAEGRAGSLDQSQSDRSFYPIEKAVGGALDEDFQKNGDQRISPFNIRAKTVEQMKQYPFYYVPKVQQMVNEKAEFRSAEILDDLTKTTQVFEQLHHDTTIALNKIEQEARGKGFLHTKVMGDLGTFLLNHPHALTDIVIASESDKSLVPFVCKALAARDKKIDDDARAREQMKYVKGGLVVASIALGFVAPPLGLTTFAAVTTGGFLAWDAIGVGSEMVHRFSVEDQVERTDRVRSFSGADQMDPAYAEIRKQELGPSYGESLHSLAWSAVFMKFQVKTIQKLLKAPM